MKKTLIFSNLFWVMLFSVLFFKNCTPEKTSEPCADLSKSYEKTPFVGFPGEVTYRMAKIYQDGVYKDLSKRLGKEDTRGVWFNLDSLKRYIWTIEKAACETGGARPEDLGIRVYFAQYPAAEEIRKHPAFSYMDDETAKNVAGMRTVYFVPTKNTGGSHDDYDVLKDWRLKKEGKKDPREEGARNFAPQYEPFESSFNHATLCPVACGSGGGNGG